MAVRVVLFSFFRGQKSWSMDSCSCVEIDEFLSLVTHTPIDEETNTWRLGQRWRRKWQRQKTNITLLRYRMDFSQMNSPFRCEMPSIYSKFVASVSVEKAIIIWFGLLLSKERNHFLFVSDFFCFNFFIEKLTVSSSDSVSFYSFCGPIRLLWFDAFPEWVLCVDSYDSRNNFIVHVFNCAYIIWPNWINCCHYPNWHGNTVRWKQWVQLSAWNWPCRTHCYPKTEQNKKHTDLSRWESFRRFEKSIDIYFN